MDLMSVSSSYRELVSKYNHFGAPTVELLVGTKKLVSSASLHITELEVELTSGYEASGCSFLIEGAYEEKNTNFSSETEVLQIGEKIEVMLGYIRTETVFRGYINRVEYEFGGLNSGYGIRVECMDAKGILMKTRRLEVFSQKKADALVGAILGEQPVSSYLWGKEIDRCPDLEPAFRSNMRTDYEIIREQAEKLGYEFFILQGKAYFRKKEKSGSPIMTLTPKEGLISAKLDLSGDGLVKEIEVRAIDEESGKLISGKAVSTGSFSKGSSGSRLLGQSRQVYYEAGIRDAKEAKDRAKARMDASQEQFGVLECECIGIPELAPGRYVQVKKLSKTADRTYYIIFVRHRLDAAGYHTFIKGRIKSL